MDNVYEYSQSLHLEDKFADLCRTKDEVDAVVTCKEIIDDNRDSYIHALAHQPKDTTGRQKKLNKLLAEAKNTQQIDDIFIEWKAVYHWRSEVKDIKYDVLESCTEILEGTGMGKKQRLKLLPRLTKYLKSYPKESSDEKAQRLLSTNRINNLLDKLK